MDKEEGGREGSLPTRPRSVKPGPQLHVHDLHYACKQLGVQAGAWAQLKGPCRLAERVSCPAHSTFSCLLFLFCFVLFWKKQL